SDRGEVALPDAAVAPPTAAGGGFRRRRAKAGDAFFAKTLAQLLRQFAGRSGIDEFRQVHAPMLVQGAAGTPHAQHAATVLQSDPRPSGSGPRRHACKVAAPCTCSSARMSAWSSSTATCA